ncbi:hypothetical protein IWW45_007861 [Coemansia sp. RSA 485]|nr:hypothetical protein IWW45_007861 [Coemansia sp. RSA 485]
MLRSTELDWQSCPSDSGSDTVDAVRIIRSSGLLRNRLAHYYNHNGASSAGGGGGGGGLSDLSSAEEIEDADFLDPGIELELLQQKDNDGLSSEPGNTVAGFVGSSTDKAIDSLRWCPQFLSEACVADMPSEPPQPTSEMVIRTDDAVPDLSRLSDAEHQRRYYPLRQRSEKNLHPYTKLVWTNPADLLDSRNRRRDASLLYELSRRDAPAQSTIHEVDMQEDSQDAEYIPGVTETAEQESQMVDYYMDLIGEDAEPSQTQISVPPLRHPSRDHAVAPLSANARKEGLTYKHLAARRRQAKAASSGTDQHISFPSIEELLAGGHSAQHRDLAANQSTDDLGARDEVTRPNDVHRASMSGNPHRVKLYSELSPSPTSSPPLLASGIDDVITLKRPASQCLEADRVVDEHEGVNRGEGSGDESPTPPASSRRRRLLSRRRDADRNGVSEDDEPLPTAKARKLNKISRRHIRGVLPFSFMRGFDKEKRSEIQEEVSRWQHRNDERPRVRRVLSSSPRQALAMEGGSDGSGERGNVESAQTKDAVGGDGATSLGKRQPLFDFNFLDIYRWSYPELAPVEQVGRAPDFLRIAARECRRKPGVMDADDPWRKHIRIAPRKGSELDDEDIAQSILGAWRLGIMDVRRVYFCDDEQDTQDESEGMSLEEMPYLERFYDDSGPEQDDPAILISDDEAAEDNSLLDVRGNGLLMSTGSRSTGAAAGHRRRKRAGVHRAQAGLGSSRPRLSGASRPSLMMSGDRHPSRSLRGQMASAGAPAAARDIRAVIGEFAAFDSDEDKDESKAKNRIMDLPPAAVGRHVSRKRRDEVRRHDFIRQFNRWRPAPTGPGAARSGARIRGGISASSAGGRNRAVNREEFLFDDDPVSQEPVGHLSASHIRTHRKRQTRIVPRQQVRSSAAAVDAVAERIGKAVTSKPAQPRRNPWTNVVSARPARAASRKMTQPTRVQMRFASGATGAEQAQPGPQTRACDDDEPEELLFGLRSGTRFHSDCWVGQGGIQRMRRLLGGQAQGATDGMETETEVFHYNDILSISADAPVDDFCRAFGMLCMVWRQSSGNDAVLRWMEFSQLYVSRRSRQPKDLAAVTSGVVACAHAQLPSADAPVALVLGVTLMQLSRKIGDWGLWRQAQRGAVGCDSEELEAWPAERLAKEVDNCVLVAAGLLALKTDITFLGFDAQLIVALLHALDAVAELVPVAPIEDAVLKACMSSEHAGAHWRALARLATLAQINQDGVAAPKPAAQWHRALCSLAEAAVDRDLRPGLGEAAVRQVFVRVHRLVSLGLCVAPTSRLHVLLFRFLEARRFASLDIEPAPALPRFFTRYSGVVPMQGGLDTCTVLWLRALDAAFGDWATQLADSRAPKTLRSMRVLVSKLLPTRILTVDSSQGLAALANYYAVVLFFLHAVPHAVVRPARLYSQLQALLRFRESASFTARRVYFEAWSAAASILGHHLRLALDRSGSHVADSLAADGEDAEMFNSQGIDPGVGDYFLALGAAISGWADTLGVLVAENSADAWRLADAALAYAVRVLQSAALAGHAPTVLLLVLRILRTSPVMGIVSAALSPSVIAGPDTCFSVLSRMRAIVGMWQQVVAAKQELEPPPTVAKITSDATGRPDETTVAEVQVGTDDGQLCSQSDFGFIDSGDLLAVAAEAEELERQAAFAPIDRAIMQTVHDNYIPDIRRFILSRFSTLGPSPRIDKRALDMAVLLLAEMVAICVDAGIRTWESFLDEHGRDSLYLIPDADGRRRVLLVFAMCAVDILRRNGRAVGALEGLVKDVWFASICDIRLSGHVQRLSAQLHWADMHGSDTPVFDLIPINVRVLDQLGALKHAISQRSAIDDLVPEEAAAVAVAFVDCVLQKMASLAGSDRCSPGMVHVFCSWIHRMLDAQKMIREAYAGAFVAVSDTRPLIDAMSERILSLVRSHCVELPISC